MHVQGKKGEDSLLQNMEMGNSSQWYAQDGTESSPASPTVQEMSASADGLDSPPSAKPAEARRAAKSDAPDLSYINSDVPGKKAGPPASAQAAAPAPRQPPGAQLATPPWADVGLD